MNKTFKVKMLIDIFLTLSLLFLMPYGLVGEALHEWIGVAMFFLFLLHHLLNRKWIANLLKGKYSAYRFLQTALVAGVLLCILGSMVSGVVLSRYVFDFLNIGKGISLARNTHMICAYWGFVLMSLHLGLHWNMFLVLFRRFFKTSSVLRTRVARIAGLLIAGYGIYAFVKRSIGSYMLMKIHFVFLDYNEPFVLFLLDYIAVMGLFVLIGYYLGKFLKQINSKTKKLHK